MQCATCRHVVESVKAAAEARGEDGEGGLNSPAGAHMAARAACAGLPGPLAAACSDEVDRRSECGRASAGWAWLGRVRFVVGRVLCGTSTVTSCNPCIQLLSPQKGQRDRIWLWAGEPVARATIGQAARCTACGSIGSVPHPGHNLVPDVPACDSGDFHATSSSAHAPRT